MEEMIKEAVIRQCNAGGYDTVFIVKNLPKRFIYGMYAKMVMRVDRDGYSDGIQIPDKDGAKEWELHAGIKYDKGTDSYMFRVDTQDGTERLKDIDQYIDAKLPREMRRPERVILSSQRGNFQANPITRDQMPVVDLPDLAPVSPPAQAVQEGDGSLEEAKLQAMRDRAAKARAAKKKKEAVVGEK